MKVIGIPCLCIPFYFIGKGTVGSRAFSDQGCRTRKFIWDLYNKISEHLRSLITDYVHKTAKC